jgi:aminoglycoside phosphotransferase (APT) family kinase protein
MDPLHGVLHSDRLDRFVRRFGLRECELEANFDSWHKRVILSPSSAFLFPRYEDDVAQVQREAAALGALDTVALAPALIGVWDEPDISPHPFLQTERRFGTNYADIEDDLSLEQVGDVLERLGAATATWHALSTDDVPDILRSPPEPFSDAFLQAETLRERLEEAQDRLCAKLPADLAPFRSWADVWESLLAPLTGLAPVLTHGDIHETQLIVDEELRLAAVLDWDHAALAHPTRDFNFGEWGFGIFAWEERFDALYERYWEAYRRARSVSLPDHRSVLLYRAMGDALYACKGLETRPDSWWMAHRLRRCAEHIRAVTLSAS